MTDASHFHGFANVHNLMRYSLLGDGVGGKDVG